MIDVTVLSIYAILLVNKLLDHVRWNTAGYIELDIVKHLRIVYEMSVLDFQVMRMVHKHSLTPYVALLVSIPSESYLHRTI